MTIMFIPNASKRKELRKERKRKEKRLAKNRDFETKHPLVKNVRFTNWFVFRPDQITHSHTARVTFRKRLSIEEILDIFREGFDCRLER